MLNPYRIFDAEPQQRALAYELYQSVSALPLLCPHGHVDPRLFAASNFEWGTPVDLFILPDHYLVRMLYSQGISLERLGIPRRDGAPVETDHRKIWQTFAEHFFLFRATPSGLWLTQELNQVFDIHERLNGDTAQDIYDAIAEKLALDTFQPRALYERFHIQVLCTTDSATDPLEQHRAIRASGWRGKILPTFRPDALLNLSHPQWHTQINALAALTRTDIGNYNAFLRALETRRAQFQQLGALATDHGATLPYTTALSNADADALFQRALHRQASSADARRFLGHMLMEMARMSTEDGMVMQLHVGSHRNHNAPLFEQFGADRGADIPLAMEFTHNLLALLNRFGNDSRLTLILFTLDESTYTRELAPLAGHYPALKLGPPWWFHDSVNGIRRYLDSVMETAGIYNTVGFNDDTRAFPSIPARHDVWRRACATWLAGLAVRGIIEQNDANEMMRALAYELARSAYKIDRENE
jgi:glucuronate isomerase